MKRLKPQFGLIITNIIMAGKLVFLQHLKAKLVRLSPVKNGKNEFLKVSITKLLKQITASYVELKDPQQI